MQPWAWRVGIPVAGSAADARDNFLQSGPASHSGRVEYDIMLARNVHGYIATRKWRVPKVTPTGGNTGGGVCGL